MQTLWQDLRYGARMSLKKPGFTLIAIITLALGIGANTAIFSFVNTALLRPLPVERPEQLVSINNVSLNLPAMSYPNFRDFRDRNNSFSGMMLYRYRALGLSHNGVNERVWGYLATGNYFEVLGVKPALGRFFTPDDDKSPGGHPIAVITYDCWQKRFAGDPQVIGKTVIVNGMVVFQVSLSLVLMICAGLALRGLQRAQSLDPGFTPRNALEMSFDLSMQGYDGPRAREFNRRLLERVRALPGVQYAGLTNTMPLSGNTGNSSIYVEGQPEQRGANVPLAMSSSASPGFLSALGTRLLEGRDFTEQDGESNQRVVVVNETFARRFWPGQSALGKRFSRESSAGPWIEVVGVIQDGKYFSLSEEAQPFVYFNMNPQSSRSLTMAVRTANEPQGAMAAIRREFQQLDATLPLYNVQTMVEHMAVPLFQARVSATLLGGFGLLALALAAIGIFGVMSYAVTQRTREIGIRMALGAQAGGILKLAVGQGLKLTALGLSIGLACAFAGTRLMSDFLYGVSALDVFTFAGAPLLLALVALLACYIPARRAMKVDPMVALRRD